MAESQQIAEKPEVKEELARATGQRAEKEVKEKARHKLSFLPHTLLLLGCAVFYYLAGTQLIPLPASQAAFAHRLLRGAALIIVVLALGRALKVFATGRSKIRSRASPCSAFN